MRKHFRFDTRSTGLALVVVFPPGVKGLFNAEIHSLVREVGEKLDGVHVHYALSSGASPDLRDALAAARFGGCDSAVVVSVGESDLARFAHLGSAGDWILAATPVHSKLDAPAVVDAYRVAIAEAGRAA